MRGWLLGLTICLSAQAAAAAELRLTYVDQEVLPYIAGSGTEIPPSPGMVIELVRRMVAGSPYRLTLTRLPARRAQEEIRAGRQDGVIGTRFTPDRAAIMVYPMIGGQPDPRRNLARLGYHLYTRSDRPVAWNGQVLGDIGDVLGIPSGVTALRVLPALAKIETLEAPNAPQLFSLLARGRVAAVVHLGSAGDGFVGRYEDADIVKQAPPLLDEDFYLPFTRRFYDANAGFAETLWRRLEVERDAIYDELRPRYRLNP